MTPELRYEPGGGTRILRSRTIVGANIPHQIRPSILVSVAWAALLAEMTGETDIVFGNVVAGRSNGLPEVEKIMDPCINIVPVRLDLRDGWTWTDVSQSMAGQLLACRPYKAFDWAEMVDECTRWPRGTWFGSAVHHRNIDWQPQFSFDRGAEEEDSQVTWFDPVYEPRWMRIVAFPKGIANLRIHLFESPKRMNDGAADMFLEKVDGIIGGFVGRLEREGRGVGGRETD